jgi:pseudouridine synthase
VAEERLQKLISRAGYGSRRSCEGLIEQGRVTVNGRIAALGEKANPARDEIRVDGALLRLPETYDYILLHKPRGVISDEDVGGNWPAARELIPVAGHLYPVGRLDVDSEGLMLFTNDGELAHRLTHPRYDHPKTYHVQVEGVPAEKVLESWRRGLMLDGQKSRPAEVTVLRRGKGAAVLEVVMFEGRKRQIRRTAAALGYPVTGIMRVKLGPLELGDLAPGAWRRLTDEEVLALKSAAARRSAPRQPRSASAPAKRRSARKPKNRSGHSDTPGRSGPSGRKPKP